MRRSGGPRRGACHNYVYENISSPARCEFGRPSSPLSNGLVFRRVPRASKLVWARTVSRNESRRPHRPTPALTLTDATVPARLADEERPVRRALVVLPPRHMTAAPRHRQSRSARLRGQLRPSDDRLASNRWARSLSGPSPACRSPVRLAARGPLACSPPPPRVPAPPRFPVHLTALRRRRALADTAAAAQAVAAPPRPNPSARACCCRRRRRSTRCPCAVRVALCMCHVYGCGLISYMSHLSLYL